MAIDQKAKALEDVIKLIKKEHGDGSIALWSDNVDKYKVDVIPTDIVELDNALGVGGIAKGRIIELYGMESSGKSTLALHIASKIQKLGGTVAYMDHEFALDPAWAEKLGVDMSKLLLSQPETLEESFNIAEKYMLSSAIDLVIFDSVASMIPKAALEGEAGEFVVGLKARIMSQALSKFAGIASRSKTILIFINQLREKIGTFGYGETKQTPGGMALKFYSSIRMDVKRIGSLKKDDIAIGNQVKIKVTKNKLAAPYKEAHFDILFDSGIDVLGSKFDAWVEAGLIQKDKSTYYYGDVKLGVSKFGPTGAIEGLKSHPEIMEVLEAAATK